MIMGGRRSGKTTLAEWLNGTVNPGRQIPNIRYGEETIDIPAAYIECPWMHCHLISSASDAYCILLLVDQSQKAVLYPPGFAKSFRVPVLGVITKSDQNPEQRAGCRQQLKRIGVAEPYYCVTGEEDSFKALKEVILTYKNRRGGSANGGIGCQDKNLNG